MKELKKVENEKILLQGLIDRNYTDSKYGYIRKIYFLSSIIEYLYKNFKLYFIHFYTVVNTFLKFFYKIILFYFIFRMNNH